MSIDTCMFSIVISKDKCLTFINIYAITLKLIMLGLDTSIYSQNCSIICILCG